MKRDPQDSSPQHSGTSRTVKRYPSSSGPITSNALPSSNGHAHSVDHSWYNHRNGHSNTPSGPSSGSHRQTNNRQLQGQFNNVLLPAGENNKLVLYLQTWACTCLVLMTSTISSHKSYGVTWMLTRRPLKRFISTLCAFAHLHALKSVLSPLRYDRQWTLAPLPTTKTMLLCFFQFVFFSKSLRFSPMLSIISESLMFYLLVFFFFSCTRVTAVEQISNITQSSLALTLSLSLSYVYTSKPASPEDKGLGCLPDV